MSKLLYALLLSFLISISAHGQYIQHGTKLVGSGSIATIQMGKCIALSADSSTLVVSAYNLPPAGGAIVYTRQDTNWIQQATFGPADNIGLSGTGSTATSLSISADGNTVAIGGPYDNDSAGTTWIYVRSGTTWSQQAKITDNTLTSSAMLGYSVALSGDGNTCILGAPNDIDTTGAVDIYTRSGTSWSRQAKLIGTGAVGKANQGTTVTISYDGNTVAWVGIADSFHKAAAWVATRTGSTWTQNGSKLNTNFVGNSPNFTYWDMGIALSGDGLTLAVGDEFGGSGNGCLRIFLKQGGVWQYNQAAYSNNHGISQPSQGSSVALSYSGNKMVFSASLDNVQYGSTQGHLYIFSRPAFAGTYTEQFNTYGASDRIGQEKLESTTISSNGGIVLFGNAWDRSFSGCASQIISRNNNWHLTPSVFATVTPGSAGQGSAVSISRDGTTLITSGTNDAGIGAFWSFKKSGGQWQQYGSKARGAGASYQNYFGKSLSLSADGQDAYVSGLSSDYLFYSPPMAVYPFHDNGNSFIQSGDSINVSGGIVFNGYNDGAMTTSRDGMTMLISFMADSNNRGATWVLSKIGNNWIPTGQKLKDVHTRYQGASVAISAHGDVAVVGGRSDSSAYIYRKTGTTWTEEGRFKIAVSYSSTISVAISDNGNTVAMGDPADSSSRGAIYVYKYDGTSWQRQAKLWPNDGGSGSNFGSSIVLSADGNTMAVGGQGDYFSSDGHFWVFKRHGITWIQSGSKYIPNDTVGRGYVGASISMTPDANTIVVGGTRDGITGATWVYDNTGLRIIADSITANRCNNSSGGKIVVHAAGGTGPYHYHWSLIGAADADTISHLSAGFYYLTVTDVTGDSVTTMFDIPVTSAIAITHSDRKACGSNPTGAITLHASGSSAPFSYLWSTAPVQTDSTATNLTPGIYNYTVTDATNCQVTGTAFIASESISTVINASAATCNANNGYAIILATGGTRPYQYVWNTTPVQTDSSAVHLAAGTYSYTVTDAIGCQTTGSHTIGFVPLHASGYATEANCHSNTGSITMYTYAGTHPYTYHWSNNTTLNPAVNLHTGLYTVTVTDSLHCQATASFYVDSFCYGLIEGTVFADVNGNCVADVSEHGWPNAIVTATLNGYDYYSYTIADGSYHIEIPTAGTYSVSTNLLPNLNCGTTPRIVNVPALGDTIRYVDFAISSDTGCYDLGAHPGWTSLDLTTHSKVYWVYVYNNNSSTIYHTDTVMITFRYDPAMIYQIDSSIYPLPSVDTLLHVLTIKELITSSAATIVTPHLNFYIPSTLPQGYILHNCFSVYASGGDCDSFDNSVCYDEPVNTSHDPNYKTCSPDSIIQEGDSVLTYTIHFQNNGGDTARFIIVKDTLSPYVDPASVTTITSSHMPYSFDLSQLGILRWTFDPIALPDSATDPINSQGFIVYKVKVRHNVPPGTVISNTAHIFFDYNSPVATNTHYNMIAHPLGISESSAQEHISVTAIPNPFSESVTFKVSGITGKYDFELLDITGKLISKSTDIGSGTFKYDRGNIASGIYLYKVIDRSHNESIGKLVVE